MATITMHFNRQAPTYSEKQKTGFRTISPLPASIKTSVPREVIRRVVKETIAARRARQGRR